MKTRRMTRYALLRTAWFLPFEARPLSKVPQRVPYFLDLVAQRAKMKGEAIRMGTTVKQFELQIRELYRVNNWIKLNRRGQKIGDPWKMFREFEDKFKPKNPAYTSPWMKRQTNLRDFIAKYERSVAKQ